jgi:hypothetical protein
LKTTAMQRFLREPLLHFIIIGGLFFLLYAVINDTGSGSAGVIRITPERIAQLATEFKAVWNRPPSDEELDHLINEEVRSEVYYRDALALGLDNNDAIVRRRLRQKMEFLTDTGIYLQDPAEGELELWFTENAQNYVGEPSVSFEQIYLGEAPSQEIVSSTLNSLRSDPAIDLTTLGQRTRLPAQLKLSRPDAVDSVFGDRFYSQIAGFTPLEWDGPVTSAYGTHLVRNIEVVAASMPALEKISEAVLRDWKSSQADLHREVDYEKRRSRYTVEIRRNESKDLP